MSVRQSAALSGDWLSTKRGPTTAIQPAGDPVKLVFYQHFERLEDAAAAERQIKGWRREKKEALIRRDYALLPLLARRGSSKRTDRH
jgi:predicted GIY-YIG superfamily endonuclease